MSKFTHQVSFCQALWGKSDDGLTACWLPEEAALVGIEVQFEHLVAQVRTQIVVITPQAKPPVGANAAKPATGRQVRKDAIQVEHLGFAFWTIEATRMQGLGIGLEGSAALEDRAWKMVIEHGAARIEPSPERRLIRPVLARASLAGSWFGACLQSWHGRWDGVCA